MVTTVPGATETWEYVKEWGGAACTALPVVARTSNDNNFEYLMTNPPEMEVVNVVRNRGKSTDPGHGVTEHCRRALRLTLQAEAGEDRRDLGPSGGELSMKLMLGLVLIASSWLSACGGGGTPGASRPPEPPPTQVIRLELGATVALGSGLLSPYKLLAHPAGDDRLLVLTGRGETYSEGRLHVIDPTTLADLAEPLAIGLNGADAVVIGDRAVVVARGAERASLIDLTGWRVVSQLDLGFQAGAVDVARDGVVAIASAVSGDIVLLGTANDQLRELNRRRLETFAYDLVADATRGVVYVVQPLRGVEVLNAQDLAHRNLVSLAGEPGRGAALWRDYLVVANRDGYLHFVDRSSLGVQTLDLATELGLDRGSLPSRGIDPSEVRALDDERLLVVNGRQSSLVLDRVTDGTAPARALAKLPGGQSATYLAGIRRVFVAQPSENRITSTPVPLAPVRGSSLPSQYVTTGREIVDWAPVGTGSQTVAVQDSIGSIHVVDDRGSVTTVLAAPAGQTWRAPFLPITDGFVINSVQAGGQPRLTVTDSAGIVQRTVPLNTGSLFSLASAGDTVLAISRLTRQLQFVDLGTGGSRIVTVNRDRPRLAVALGSSWIVAHDTTPDIGITLIRNDVAERFEAFDDWFVGLVAGGTTQALTASFLGSVATVDADGRLGQVRRLGIPNVSRASVGRGQTVWLTSESLGFAHRIHRSSFAIEGRYDQDGLRAVLAFPGSESLALVTARSVQVASE
jgi:hypothetical protein